MIRLLSAKFRLINAFSTRKAGKGSIDVLIHPMQGRIIPQYASSVAPSKSAHRTSVDDLNVKLYDWGGDGVTTLLVHGWDSNSYRWYEMIDHVGRDAYRFVALDGPYHGESEGDHFNMSHFANMIEVALETFEPKYIIAHSLGALALAHLLQRKNYTRVQKIVLLAPIADLSWHIDRYHQLLSLKPKTRQAMDTYFEHKFNMKFADFTFKHIEQELGCDIYIIHDQDDPVVPLSDSTYIHELFEGSELEIVRGYGHKLQGEEVFDKISTFLDR